MKAFCTRLALIIALAALGAAGAWASESKSEPVVPVGPPQPRVVEPMRPQSLPPRTTDPSWLYFKDGEKLFEERRLGESLVSFKAAIEARAALFKKASTDIAAALASKEAAKARGSLSKLVALLAVKDLIPQEFEALRSEARGSIVAELGLIRERSPSSLLRGLVDATLLVVEERGLSRIGDSLTALKKAADELGLYPEAEFRIAKVYLAEGEARLAELQILRAYGMSSSLEVGEEKFSMLETLAGIYKSQGKLKEYELRLREIADASDLFLIKDAYYRNAMERTLAAQGFDKFMLLYRVQDGFAAGAYSALGALYLEAGRPLAVIYLAAAANAALTRTIAAIKTDSPGYTYAGLSDLAARILGGRELSLYAAQAGLWRDLVLLGEALANSGNRDTAREVWATVAGLTARLDTSGAVAPWARRAAADLAGVGRR